jgi:hypothetical protein
MKIWLEKCKVCLESIVRLYRNNPDSYNKYFFDAARNEFDATIQETEAAYMKILESSQTLLNVLKREAVNLTKKNTR